MPYTPAGLLQRVKTNIQRTREALDEVQDSRTEQARLLTDLGRELGRLYSYQRRKKGYSTKDLTESICAIRNAIELTPRLDPDRPERLHNLSIQLRNKYGISNDILDLDEAIVLGREAIVFNTQTHEDWGMWVVNLSECVFLRYSRTGAMTDLEEAIDILDRSFGCNIHESSRIRVQELLGQMLGESVSRTADIADIDRAISVARSVSDLTSISYADGGERRMTLGILLSQKYKRTGDMQYLDEAIQHVQDAVNAIQVDLPFGVERLNVLGNLLGERFSRLGAIADINDAVRFNQQAVDISLASDEGWLDFLNDFGVALTERYARLGTPSDLGEALRVTQVAVEALRADTEISLQAHRNKTTILANLGKLLGYKYVTTDQISDLEEAIRVHREAVEPFLGISDHKGRAGRLCNLGSLLGRRHKRLGETNDMEEAINVTREALRITPEDNPERAMWLDNLGTLLSNKSALSGMLEDIEEAIVCYQSALFQPNAPTVIRILAGIEATHHCARTKHWKHAHDISAYTIQLVPYLAPRSLEQLDKQHVIAQIVGLACDAAAIALQADKPSLAALCLLEQGRGALATSLEEMRTDISDLSLDHAELAEQFAQLRDELEQPMSQRSHLINTSDYAVQARATKRHDISSQLEALILDIRKLPGHEQFLLPPQNEDMKHAAEYGPIAIINVSQYRCDALLVQHSRIWSVPLPSLNLDDIYTRIQRRELGNMETLKWLWETIAAPVLDALAITSPPSDGKWPRMWWIPTGALTKFPLHAAGNHKRGSCETVLDRAMSSYTPSVKALLQGRRVRYTASVGHSKPNQALLVAMQSTPEYSYLRFAKREVEALNSICNSMSYTAIQVPNRKANIMSTLPACRIFHFAGHGYTDAADPSKSALILEDWKQDPFTIGTLLEMNLRSQEPFLAFLSACGTGEVSDKRYFDEGLHIISAFQLAGFRHVIGTLWEIEDGSCVAITSDTYEGMRQGGMTDVAVCAGLHGAIRRLRDCWLEKDEKDKAISPSPQPTPLLASKPLLHEDLDLVRKIVLVDSDEESDDGMHGEEKPSYMKDWRGPPWVPYVHFGV
ncbi:hypothetical protein CC86DRAFT_307360 [Ophiobolus disseminans]|uniref:CHAT domain-containing protein n=1 Tax=Ophiobolus disseminans TaxID=1469910 RepID=A0A6A6ZGF3_9PLEO|nr:hypothetical protein CC86DRAFT_307360 [Ophiobolus disseminans]